MRLLALLAYGLFALLLLLGLGLYGLLSQLDLEALTEAGDELLRENYALTLSVSEDSSLTLFPQPAVVLRDAELRTLEAPDAPPLAQVGELALTVDLAGALKGARAPVQGIALRDVEITVDPARFAGDHLASPEGSAQRKGKDDRLRLSLPAPDRFPVQRIELSNVTLRVASAGGAAALALEGLKGALGQDGDALVLSLAGASPEAQPPFPSPWKRASEAMGKR